MARALGRYELLRPLARGGMAEVYLARRRAAGVEKWLVVKRMRPERSGDPRFLDLFVREARLSMSLVHQNIVPVFDFGRIDDQVFLAMERVEGKDLGSSLARAPGRCMPPLLAAFVAAECCQALEYAHQRKGPDGVALGIVHRDVTPRNVLLSWSGEVKLTDFGIAALAGEATARLLGTPQYMAPEQARSEPIDPRADIYAVGLSLREALSGIRPRPGSDRESILEAARRGALLPWPQPAPLASAPLASAPLSDLPVDLALGSGDHSPEEAREPPPTELVAIADRATASAPGDRYPDARSMLEALDRYIVGERSRHKAESPARQLATWLAATWEGARDEAAADAAIDADHLVSFLDDGAFDLIGTGTVRSLAATAADDAHVGAPPAPGADSSADANAAAPAPRRASESGGRSTRVSSANSTVAAGSFDALPAAASNDPEAPSPPRRRSTARLAAIALVGAAAVAVVVAVRSPSGSTTAKDPRAASPPVTIAALPPEQPSAAQPTAAQPTAAQPTAAQPTAAQPTAGQPTAAQPTAAQPTAAQPGAMPPNGGRTATEQPNNARASTGRPIAGQSPPSSSAAPPRPSSASTGRSTTGPQAPDQRPDASQRAPDAASGPQVGRSTGAPPTTTRTDAQRSSPDALKPATCRVRINFTPWAYYTVDHDAARHETPGTIDIAPGEHRLHVWNPELHIERDIVLTVPADRDTMSFSEPLQPPALHSDAPKP